MPRRKPGTLLALESEILDAALSMSRAGQASFHGFGLAESLREQTGSKALTAHGTLYKALGRLEEFELLSSSWEDAAAARGRPRRRLYELTERGAQVAERARAERIAASERPRAARAGNAGGATPAAGRPAPPTGPRTAPEPA